MTLPGWIEDGEGDWSRIDPDGTRWTICAETPDVYVLAMRYRGHRLISRHESADAAKQHREDMVKAFAARSLRDYAGRG